MINGFTVLKEQELSYFRGKGIWLRHDRTGLEIFKFITDKINNYFCFNFKTPIEDDRGIAHILEHSVLHGSEKYPDSELFFKLQQKSPCKDLNACTAKIFTSFYAETCVEKDFYNLLDMIGDSVFFPLLSDEVFMQEGWRLEYDENGAPKINGVVYNEMNTSDVKANLYYGKINRTFMPGSNENYFQGGDPVCITDCNIDDIRNFHKKYYVPKNCMLFLFGNIDLDEQLKFLDENLLCRLPSDSRRAESNDIVNYFSETKHYEFSRPHYGTNQSSIELRFLIKDGERDEINTRDDFFNLLNYALIEELMAPRFGSSAELDTFGTSSHRILVLSLYNVEQEDIPEAKKYMLSLFEKIADEGIDKNTVEFFCTDLDHNFEDNEFEVKPAVLNDPAFSGWNESDDPFVNLVDPETFWTKDKEMFLNADNNLFQNLTKKYITENPHKAFIVTTPDKNYFSEIEKLQKEKLNDLLKKISQQKINEDFNKYEKFQQDCFEGKNSVELPKVKISDLTLADDAGIAEHEIVKTKNGDVHLFSSSQEIFKKTYFSIYFPLDVLSPEELFVFSENVPLYKKLGFGQFDVKTSFEVLANATVEVCDFSFDSCHITVYCKNEKEFENRYWLSVSFSIFNRNIDEGIKLAGQYLFNKNFNDISFINQAKQQYKVYIEQSKDDKAKSYGSHFIHAQCSNDTILSDYLLRPQVVENYKKLQKENLDEFVNKAFEVYKKVISSGALVNVFASKEQIEKSKNAVKGFISEFGICSLKGKFNYDVKDLRSKIKVSEKIKEGREINSILTKEDYNSVIGMFNISKYPSKEFAAEDALLMWFSNTVLYEQIRKYNGAYNVDASTSASNGVAIYSTGRDPDPIKSLEIFLSELEKLSNKNFSEDELTEIVVKTYGLAIGDIPPKDRGDFCFDRWLSGLNPEYRKQRLENLLKLTTQDLENAAKRLYEYSKNLKAVIITDDENKISGDVILSF